MVERKFSKVKIFALIILAVVIFITAAGVFLLKNNRQASKQIFLSSIFNNREEYEDVFSKLSRLQGNRGSPMPTTSVGASGQKPTEDVNAVAGIISHHFLAKQLIADFYNKVGSDKVSIVFLVSPDHYNNYFKPDSIAYTSYLNWDTPFGVLQTDNNSIKNLLSNKNIEINDSAMGLEHGIYVEAPFIKKFFPNAKIVPLVLKNNLPYEKFLSLGNAIKKISNNNSILIVSSDFTHDASADQASANDKKSIDVLKNLSADKVDQVTNDCKQCIATLSGFLGDNNQNNFYLINNENSFDISGQDKNSVTSYVSGYYSKNDYAKIMFVGDIMFDRGIRYYSKINGSNDFIFDKIYPTLADNDLVIANLEGPITNNKSVSAGTAIGSADNYFFTFDPSVAKTLFEKNIRLVDLGNNHVLNFGQPGLDSTQKYLTAADVNYFGAPSGARSIIENIARIKLGFVSYNEFAKDQAADVINEIKKVKQEADITVVFCHWGIEYSLTPTDEMKTLAHQFIDAGADLVVGSHPHVIEPMEEYNGKRIYYSLGNFIFDQYFNEDVRNGLGVVVKINKDTKQLDFSEKHFYLDSNGQTLLR